jgi:hypothetical protein
MADADDFDVEALRRLMRGESAPETPAPKDKPGRKAAAPAPKPPRKAAAGKKAKPAARGRKSAGR